MTRVLGEQALEEVLEHRGHRLGPTHRVLDDKADQLEDTVRIERGLAGEQLVEDTTEGPVE